jgi:DNA-binding transcriptional ArsR family regulator
MMLEPLMGSGVRELVLLFLYSHKESYAREIALRSGRALNLIQTQLRKLEAGGVVYSRLRGRTRLFALSPRYPFRRELEALLRRALEFLPPAERERLYSPRLRPRRTGKP